MKDGKDKVSQQVIQWKLQHYGIFTLQIVQSSFMPSSNSHPMQASGHYGPLSAET